MKTLQNTIHHNNFFLFFIFIFFNLWSDLITYFMSFLD